MAGYDGKYFINYNGVKTDLSDVAEPKLYRVSKYNLVGCSAVNYAQNIIQNVNNKEISLPNIPLSDIYVKARWTNSNNTTIVPIDIYQLGNKVNDIARLGTRPLVNGIVNSTSTSGITIHADNNGLHVGNSTSWVTYKRQMDGVDITFAPKLVNIVMWGGGGGGAGGGLADGSRGGGGGGVFIGVIDVWNYTWHFTAGKGGAGGGGNWGGGAGTDGTASSLWNGENGNDSKTIYCNGGKGGLHGSGNPIAGGTVYYLLNSSTREQYITSLSHQNGLYGFYDYIGITGGAGRLNDTGGENINKKLDIGHSGDDETYRYIICKSSGGKGHGGGGGGGASFGNGGDVGQDRGWAGNNGSNGGGGGCGADSAWPWENNPGGAGGNGGISIYY